MEVLSKQNFKSLAEFTSEVCVSIYLPVNKRGLDTKENPIRLKNLISGAVKIAAKWVDAELEESKENERQIQLHKVV